MSGDLVDLLPRDVASWPAVLDGFDAAARGELGFAIVQAWIEGRLEPRLLDTPAVAALRQLRRRLAEAVAPFDCWEHEWGGIGIDEADARRWCWIRAWRLCSQDDDLAVMREPLIGPLLDEAAAGCTKRDDVLSIVSHFVRDQAHATLRDGHDVVHARLRELGRFRAPAVAADHAALVEYIDRLAALAPGRVDAAEAAVRIADLWPCHAPQELALESVAHGWRAQICTAPGREAWIAIDLRTGAMRIDGPGPDRAQRAGTHG